MGLTNCTNCGGFDEPLQMESPEDLKQLLWQIYDMLRYGMFRYLGGTLGVNPMDTLVRKWGDRIDFKVGCTVCCREYRLEAETQSGAGGRWEAIS
ncbi:MAG: hypothetical protein Q8R76_08115 [Candidatus Omnitrophota bacterium]|nr:hypothetical protein [Candidatus Omnitrophota bacterium]